MADKSLKHIPHFDTMPLAGADGWSLVVQDRQGSLANLRVDGFVQAVFTQPPLTLIKTVSDNYTVSGLDHGYLIRVDALAPTTVTLVADSVENIAIGTSIIVSQAGVGSVAFSAGAGATVVSPVGLTLAQQWAKATVIKTAANTWEIDGFLTV